MEPVLPATQTGKDPLSASEEEEGARGELSHMRSAGAAQSAQLQPFPNSLPSTRPFQSKSSNGMKPQVEQQRLPITQVTMRLGREAGQRTPRLKQLPQPGDVSDTGAIVAADASTHYQLSLQPGGQEGFTESYDLVRQGVRQNRIAPSTALSSEEEKLLIERAEAAATVDFVRDASNQRSSLSSGFLSFSTGLASLVHLSWTPPFADVVKAGRPVKLLTFLDF